jgi:ribosomal protein S4
MTSLRRQHRRKYCQKQLPLSRFRYRSLNRSHTVVAGVSALYKDKLLHARSSKVSSAKQLSISNVVTSPVTPLYFKCIDASTVKSGGAKKKALIANIASKETRYKITAQYAESLSEFIPALINQMLSKKIERAHLCMDYRSVQHLLRNIYWSLRVYLNVDPFDSRFDLREQSPIARLQLAEAISKLSNMQVTEQPQRALLRHRFQPGRIPLAASTSRFRGDWLRAFFPEKHALYQEDPDDYGLFLFRTRDIRRLRIGGSGMSSWRTAYQGVSHETRARQMLSLRYSRTNARFETLLQTLRRSPQLEYTPNVSLRSTRSSYFSRQYSTYVYRDLSLSTKWVHRKKRFVSFENRWRTVTPIQAVTSRNSTLSRIGSRGKTSYVATTWSSINNSFLDTRFARAKSPRSRQYVLRTSQCLRDLTKTERFSRVSAYRALRALTSVSAGGYGFTSWTRRTRRATFPMFYSAIPHAQNKGERFSLIRRLRSSTATGSVVEDALARSLFLRVSSSAGKRTMATQINKAVALLPDTVVISGLTQRTRSNWVESIALGGVNKVATRCWPVVGSEYRTFSKRAEARVAPIFATSLQAALNSRISHRSRGAKCYAGVTYFNNQAGRQIIRKLDLARACAAFTRERRKTPFDSYRPRLWNKLTLRWMKKYRVGRYWLRDTSRWLRDPWLSQIVGCDMSLRPDAVGGELRSREQQVGEYVAEVDDEGRDILEKDAPFRERHSLAVRNTKFKSFTKRTAGELLSPVALLLKKQRLRISQIARRKPIPSMWLANYECRDAVREYNAEKVKPRKQKEEEEQERVKGYWARKLKNLPEEKPRRAPLKHPANLWLPRVIWNEIQRRVRKFEWRESDEVFFRPGFRNAFRFQPNERNRAPWLEHLMYTRATYSTRLHEFRRWQLPREQKKYKWLQRVRKTLYPSKTVKYIKGRRWHQLRKYNQKLHYSLFNLRDRGAARRHFTRLSYKSRPSISSFVSASSGLTNRLDVTLMQLGVAPSIYWARIVAQFCLMRVNGVLVSDPEYLLQPGDILQPEWDSIARFQHYFKPYLSRREAYQRKNQQSTAFYPLNFEYHKGTRALVFKHAPDESDLRRSNRLQPNYFRWFKLDSV